jgi:hypothetical protein
MMYWHQWARVLQLVTDMSVISTIVITLPEAIYSNPSTIPNKESVISSGESDNPN